MLQNFQSPDLDVRACLDPSRTKPSRIDELISFVIVG